VINVRFQNSDFLDSILCRGNVNAKEPMEQNRDTNCKSKLAGCAFAIATRLRYDGLRVCWRSTHAFPPKMATLTGAIGTGSKWLLDKIVGAIAATGINPNFLTFLGLVVNFGAAACFAVGKFFYGAVIIFIAGFLDMLDGQVARRQNRVTAFGAFYDSTLDRYADMALYMGLLVYYSVSGRTPYVILAACSYRWFGDGELRAGPRRVADSAVQSWLHGAARAAGAADHRRIVEPHGARAVGDRRGFHHYRNPPHRLHLARNPRGPHATRHQAEPLDFPS
jgi:hypothetical protein